MVKLELWRIDDSFPAVKFQVISRPNDWTKNIRQSTIKTNLTDTKLLQLEFWSKFKEYAQEKGRPLKLRKAKPQHWYDMSCGVSGAHITLTINTLAELIGCEIYIPDSKELYYSYEQHKDDIEKELGFSLEWMELPNKKASRIKISTNADISKRFEWKNYFDWLIEMAEKFQEVFYKYATI